MGVADVRRLKQLEVGNATLKRLSPTLASTRRSFRTCSERSLTRGQRRGLVGYAWDAYRVTERRACRVPCVPRATIRYVSVRRGQGAGGPSHADQVIRRGAPGLELAADPPAALRGLSGQSQAYRAPESPGRPESKAKSALPSNGRGDARAVDRRNPQGRALEHALLPRPAAGRSKASRSDRG